MKYKKVVDIINQLEKCGYITDNGLHTLAKNQAFIALKAIALSIDQAITTTGSECVYCGTCLNRESYHCIQCSLDGTNPSYKE